MGTGLEALIPLLGAAAGSSLGGAAGSTAIGGSVLGPLAGAFNFPTNPLITSGIMNPLTTQGLGGAMGGVLGGAAGIPLAGALRGQQGGPPVPAPAAMAGGGGRGIPTPEFKFQQIGPPQAKIGGQADILAELRRRGLV